MAETRLSLALPSEPRSASLDKDSLLTNACIESSKVGSTYAVKRPGFQAGYEGTTTDNLGVWFNDGVIWTIDPDDPSVLLGFIPSTPIGFGEYTVISDEDFV